MKYLTQKDIMTRFRDDTTLTEIKVYISYVGYYAINGRRSISNGFTVIEPKAVTIRFEQDGGFISFHCLDDLDNETINSFGSSMFSANRNDNPLYPLNKGIISHFDSHVDIYDCNDEKIDWEGHLVDKIKFFETLDFAELNFVVLLRNHLENNKLVEALSTYDRIVEKHIITNPSELLKSI